MTRYHRHFGAPVGPARAKDFTITGSVYRTSPPLARRHPSIDPVFFSTLVAITNPLFHTISKPLPEAARMLPILVVRRPFRVTRKCIVGCYWLLLEMVG